MDLRDYVVILRKHWLVISACAVVGVCLALLATITATKVYSATAQCFVALGQSTSEGDLSANSSFAMQRVKSYTDLIKSPDVVNGTIQDLGLTTSTGQVAGMLSAQNPPSTLLINVTATSTNPQQAADVANAAAINLGRQVETLETPPNTTTSPVKVTVTRTASVPGSPVSPRPTVNLALGLLLGLGLGVTWALLRERFDTSVKTAEQLTEVTGKPTLGSVLFDPEAARTPLVALMPNSVRAEGFRAIRTSLQYVNVDKPPREVVVTSSVPGEGKTTTACNLAITLAQVGARVCLLEADLRLPAVTKYVGINPEPGLTTILTGQATIEQAAVPWIRGLLDVIPAGLIPPNPSEMLGSRQMRQLLDELRARYDVIVIDSPPLLPVTDAAILARQADGCILVTRCNKTSVDELEKALEVLTTVGSPVLGCVLNFVPVRRSYGSDYEYGYGYGYGYTGDRGSRGLRRRLKGLLVTLRLRQPRKAPSAGHYPSAAPGRGTPPARALPPGPSGAPAGPGGAPPPAGPGPSGAGPRMAPGGSPAFAGAAPAPSQPRQPGAPAPGPPAAPYAQPPGTSPNPPSRTPGRAAPPGQPPPYAHGPGVPGAPTSDGMPVGEGPPGAAASSREGEPWTK